MYKITRIPLSYFLFIIGLALMFPSFLKAQEVEKKKMLRDTLDGKFDLSSYIIDAHGFIPVPVIITEPALGSFGGMIIPVFIKPKKGEDYKAAPDITAGIGMYTANGSYAYGAFRSGSFPKQGIKYRVGIVKADLNLSFYKTLPEVGEKELKFNIEALPIFFSVSKKVSKNSEIYLGVHYDHSSTTVKPRFDEEVPAVISDKELKNSTAAVGVFLDLDKRNTIFTPDSGYRINSNYNVNADWTGSDFDYQRFNTTINWFKPIKPNWISGLRFEYQQAFNSPPFYLLPSIDLRGIAKGRYQGETTLLVETEQRIDFGTRWSAVGFAGYAKAIEKKQSFSDGQNVYNGGLGFRYLLARVFKLRAGVDVAMGPDGSFGYYIVFGHNWNR